MMLLTLQRTSPPGRPRTFGELRGQSRRICYTLEDEVRELPGVPASDWKVKGATAIPSGRYRLSLETSPRFGPGTITLHDVPGFTGVRMHAGNNERDTEGCPLLGMAIDPTGIVGGTSRFAVELVKDIVRDATARGEAVYLDVVNATVTA